MGFVTFGEIMLRLTPNAHAGKINTSRLFDVNYAGSESNVASSLALLGNKVKFVTKLPDNQLGDAAIGSLRSFGIDTADIIRDGKKIGTYFIEIGSSIRPSSVIYDRIGSAISLIDKDEFDWERIFIGQKWIFISGITAALSHQCAMESIKMVKIAKRLGLKVSFDMNYRRTLWKNPEEARKIFNAVLEHTDVLFGNTGVFKDVYGMDVEQGDEIEKTIAIAKEAQEKFNVEHIICTVRQQISANENIVSALSQKRGAVPVLSNIYKVGILDRFGTGDSFAGAYLHGLNAGWSQEKSIEFAAAAFALKHTIYGDQHTSNENEIQSIMEGNTSGYVLR